MIFKAICWTVVTEENRRPSKIGRSSPMVMMMESLKIKSPMDSTLKKKLSFAPDDKISEIYRTINPQVGGADALECETLIAECQEHYGVDITEGFSESTTLGDIFHAIRKTA